MTELQARCLAFIAGYIDANGYPPSRREIASSLGMSAVSSAQEVVQRLVDKGLIVVRPGTPRAIRIVEAKMVADTEEM